MMMMIKHVHPSQPAGITLVGLGPGSPDLITRAAWEWLSGIDTLYLRTRFHPTVCSLPKTLQLISFDEVYEAADDFEAVYAQIVEQILELGNDPQGVTYAVPGHPFVAETTCPEIYARAQNLGIPVRVIDGLSFLEPTFRALGQDPFPACVLADALTISMQETPGFPPSSPALIAQIYSRMVASDVKLTLMTAYPDEHPVRLVHSAGSEEENVEDLPLYAIDQSQRLGLLSSLWVPPLSMESSFESFQEVVAKLRAPDGCPWDQAQTHLSLRPYLIEEAYEALDALDREDLDDLQEELGDLLLQIVLHAQIAAEGGDFNIHDVIQGISSKLIRRHPHVFSQVVVNDVSGVIQNWEAIKAEERQENGSSSKKGLLDGVPSSLPALLQADELIERTHRVNFDLLTHRGDVNVLVEQISELPKSDPADREAKLGEILLGLVSLSYQMEIDAENALRQQLMQFRRQFSRMEARVVGAGDVLVDLPRAEKNQLWLEAGGTEEPEK